MKIAHIVCTYPPYKGGMGNAARDFARHSARLGHETWVYYPEKSFHDRPRREENVNIQPLKPFLSLGNGAFLPQLIRCLRGFDIIYLHYPFFGGAEAVFFFKLLYGRRARLLIHYHMDTGRLGFRASALSVFSRMIFWPLIRRAHQITCASLDYLGNSSLKSYYSNHPDKFSCIPFSVDTRRFFPSAKKPGGPIRILFVGGLDRAHYFKGVNVLLEASAKLRKDDIRLVIVGRGDLRGDYQAQAAKLGIASRVEFLDNIGDSELPEVYRNSDIFVLPSVNSHEAFGLVLLEAMASGLPAVASRLPGVREVFREGVEGLYAVPGDPEDLSRKIAALIENPALRAGMGESARQRALRDYSLDAFEERLKKIYGC